MSRIDVIHQINAALATLDDERLKAVADIVQGMTSDDELPRALTDEELGLIEQSKEDFKAGRSYTIEQSRAYIDAELARRRQSRSTQ